MLNKININSSKQTLIVYILLTVVTLAVYWQVNQFDFVNFDDNIYISGKSHIQSGLTPEGVRWAFSTKETGLWNPLVWLSFMFDYQLHGLNAGGYHLTNLILHILSALLLFRLFCRMTGAIWKSAFVAALFALHPLHVESVAWIAERKDVLSAFFWMLTLCLYVYYTEKPVIRRYLLVLFCFVLALLSKPMVVTLPVVMILLDYWPLSRLTSRKIAPALTEVESASANKEKKKTKAKKEALENNIPSSNVGKLPETRIAGVMPLWQIWEKAPFFILSAILIIITLYTTDKQETTLQGLPLASRLANAPVAFVTYLEKTFWPRDLAVFYPFSAGLPAWQVLGTILLIIVISIAVIVKARRMPFLFAGWLWYAVTILPVIGIIQISFMAPYSMADRYHYLPSIGIAVILAWGIPYLFERKGMRKEILLPVSLVFIAVLSFLTWRQCGCWKNSTALWNHALQATENNYLAHNNLGNALYEEGKIKDALYYFNEAISINPDFAKLYYSRGNAYYKLGQFQLAIDDYSKAITMNPYYAGAYCNRGIVYDEKGQYRLAMEDYTQTIRLKPDYIEAYVNRGTVYGKNGQYQSAIEDYSEAILLKPDDADFYNSRAIIYFNQGNKELGCLDCQKACELGNCTILESARARGFCR